MDSNGSGGSGLFDFLVLSTPCYGFDKGEEVRIWAGMSLSTPCYGFTQTCAFMGLATAL